MEILKELIREETYNYKCYDELKRIIKNNEEYKKIIETGYLEGKIKGFDDKMWTRIKEQNIRIINSFEDVFIEGMNIGNCTGTSLQLSCSFDGCYICGGELPILKGTLNCPDGSHTWISFKNKIIDTSLMLIIDEKYAREIMGYIEENRRNPMENKYYQARKEYTRDRNLRKKETTHNSKRM